MNLSKNIAAVCLLLQKGATRIYFKKSKYKKSRQMNSFDFTRGWIDVFNFSVAIAFHRPKIRKKYNLEDFVNKVANKYIFC